MEQLAFWGAAGLSGAWTCVHIFIGGPEIAAPLLASDMRKTPKYTQYFCWHIVSATIGALALFFALAALGYGAQYAVAGTLLAAGFAVLGIAMVPAVGQSYRQMPQGWLFVPVAVLGLWGLL